MNDVIPYEERLGALSVVDIKAQVKLIQHVMREVMTKGEHYGVIPGTGTKPTLLKAGAEKLCLTFRLAPDYEIQETHEGSHIKITSKCVLTHIPSSQRFGAGMGSCSTREAKYAYRQSARKCPTCHVEAIIKGKEEYGGGWVCFKKKGGCGATWKDDAVEITSQPTGRVPNEDIADQYNTVLKMANKRSLVAAVLNATAASDIFTQDIEDMGFGLPEVDSSPEVAKVSAEQIAAINAALKETGVDIAIVLKRGNVDDISDYAASETTKIIAWIRAQGKGKTHTRMATQG